MGTAGASAGATASAAEGQLRFDDEAHIAYIDSDTADTFQKGRFEAEREPVDIKRLVVFSRLIQSQCKTRTASATGGEVDTDAGLGPVSEEGLELGTSRFGKMDHCILHVYWSCQKNRNDSRLCQGQEKDSGRFLGTVHRNRSWRRCSS